MSAYIVFANGSKQLARNTDDTRERWHLRKALTAEDVIHIHQRGVIVPEYSEPQTVEEAQEKRAELIKRVQAVEVRRQMMAAYPRVVIADYHFVQVRGLLEAQLTALNKYIKNKGIRERKDALKAFYPLRNARYKLQMLCEAVESGNEAQIKAALSVCREYLAKNEVENERE